MFKPLLLAFTRTYWRITPFQLPLTDQKYLIIGMTHPTEKARPHRRRTLLLYIL